MAENRKIFITILNAAIFIALEVAALSMLGNNSTLQSTWILKGVHAFQGTIWGGTEKVRHYFSLKKENDRLADENFRLAGQLRYYMEQAACSTRSGGDSVSADSTYSYIAATIDKISNNSQHNYIIVDKGAEDGVVPQSGIITAQGVVGIVDAVSRNYSYAISFKNTDMAVSARIGKTGPVGSLTWDGVNTDGALLNEIPHHIAFTQGDTVYTSGFSSIFPPDIPLGTAGEYKIVNGATYEIKVKLFEDFKALRYVTIVRNTGREETDSLILQEQP